MIAVEGLVFDYKSRDYFAERCTRSEMTRKVLRYTEYGFNGQEGSPSRWLKTSCDSGVIIDTDVIGKLGSPEMQPRNSKKLPDASAQTWSDCSIS